MHVQTRAGAPVVRAAAWRVKDRDVVYVDLPAFGRRCRLVWHQRRLCCPEPARESSSVTEEVPAIAPAQLPMTDRGGRWATFQVGSVGRTVNEVAVELGCDWHTVNDAVMAYGAALLDARHRAHRPGERRPRARRDALLSWRAMAHPAALVHLDRRRLLARRTTARLSSQVAAHSRAERLDLCPPRGLASGRALRRARPVRPVPEDLRRRAPTRRPGGRPVSTSCDSPTRSSTSADAGCRTRPSAHRGRKYDPLYRARRLLTKAHERLGRQGGGATRRAAASR